MEFRLIESTWQEYYGGGFGGTLTATRIKYDLTWRTSMLCGVVPTLFESAYITPLLKKPDLDPTDAKSYRPISNLSLLSKLVERLVARQIIEYLTEYRLLPKLQSAYRANHSTETALLKVPADIHTTGGRQRWSGCPHVVGPVGGFWYGWPFNSLASSTGIQSYIQSWFASRLDGRTQHVRCGSSNSHPAVVKFGVLQGSVLCPILFLLYTADLVRLIELHNLRPLLDADDAQIYGFCRPGAAAQLQDHVTACVCMLCGCSLTGYTTKYC